ncbi:MAG: hypothetical protein ACKO96_00060, partial [Flammeovirgaceae bacterium]
LNFGNDSNANIQFWKDGDNCYISERNGNNKPHGRGMHIWNGIIRIGYFDNDDGAAPGNYLLIWASGTCGVGEVYLKGGKRWARGTVYKKNGDASDYEKKYDVDD